ncbi:MAG: amino acid ABC transporter substrate-binding protein, partial [Actinomycetota bacterium]|nr:amino acid ABC transporter substrate-binding protein [Actinomycetota bacterium]
MSRGILAKMLVLLAAMTLILGACDRGDDGGGGEGNGNGEEAAQAAGGELLQEVIDRGTLRCGVNNTVPGFGFDVGGGEIDGFDIDFCRAFAAALLGDAEAIELIPIDADNRFIALQNGDYDVLVRNTTHTTSRDGAESVAFTHVNFYDGQAMMVPADAGITQIDQMNNAAVCVTTGTTTELNLADYFQERGLEFEAIAFEDNTQLQRAFLSGRCDSWTSDRSQLAGIRSAWPQNEGGPESLVILEEVMSKEPLAPGTLDTEIALHDALNAVVNGVILAEELGVNSNNVDRMANNPPNGQIAALLGAPVPDPTGAEAVPIDNGLGIPNDFMVGVLKAVGNYEEIFNRHLGPNSPLGLERGINALWTEGGIQY